MAFWTPTGTMPLMRWRWISPLLSIGAPSHAWTLGDIYSDDPERVAMGMRRDRQTFVVPDEPCARRVLELLGYSPEQVSQSLSDWPTSGFEPSSPR